MRMRLLMFLTSLNWLIFTKSVLRHFLNSDLRVRIYGIGFSASGVP